jgi:hypothetical protein
MDNKEILHKHLIQFELKITELGIKGRIEFEEQWKNMQIFVSKS